MAEETVLSTGRLQQFLSVTQDHLWCLFAISSTLALNSYLSCRLRHTQKWKYLILVVFCWSSVGQQIHAIIDADKVGGPPGSPAGFAEIKQFFLPETHFIRKLVSLTVSHLGYIACSTSRRQKRRIEMYPPLLPLPFTFNLSVQVERRTITLLVLSREEISKESHCCCCFFFLFFFFFNNKRVLKLSSF